MGTGPYMYNGQKDNDTYTFVKNPNYNRKNVDVESFKIKIIPDNDSKLLALRNKEVDLILGTNNLSYDSYNSLQKDKSFAGKTSDTVQEVDSLILPNGTFTDAPSEYKSILFLPEENAVAFPIAREEIGKDFLSYFDETYCVFSLQGTPI